MTDIAAVVETALPTDPEAVMAAVLGDTKAQSLAPETGTPERNEKGQFVAASGATTATPPAQLPDAGSEVPVEGAPLPADGTETAVEIPDGYVGVTALPEDRARGFTVRDAEGEILPPDLTWELTANGSPRTLTTDKLVAYAQMGVYNHELQQHAQQVEAKSQQVERSLAEVQQGIALRDQQIEQLLTDPDFLWRAQQAYVQQNSPEAQAQREREKLTNEKAEWQLQQAANNARQFVDTTMAPALQIIANAYPTITEDELAAKFFLAADRYRRNGVLMPEGYDPLKQWVLRSLEPEMRQLHEFRASQRNVTTASEKAAKDKAAKDVADAQAKAQKARSAATRALKPAGKAMADTAAPPVVKTLKDAEDVVLSQTMAAMRAG
jgi:hypothetical protein